MRISQRKVKNQTKYYFCRGFVLLRLVACSRILRPQFRLTRCKDFIQFRRADDAAPVWPERLELSQTGTLGRGAPFYADWSAGSLMMNSALPVCWLHSRLPPSHPSVLL